MEAARVCAERGHVVELAEKSDELGGVFKTAAIPDFKDDDKRLIDWFKLQLCKLGVTIRLNCECTPELVHAGELQHADGTAGFPQRARDKKRCGTER